MTGAPAWAERIVQGQAIVFPTSTLPALGAPPTAHGLDHVFELKGRGFDRPVSLAVLGLDDASRWVTITAGVADLLESFPRGSLTLVLDAASPSDPRLGGNRIAVRVVDHPVAREVIAVTGPLTATSANRSGAPPDRDCRVAAESLGLPVDSVVPGICPGGSPSTVLDVRTTGGGGVLVSVIREGVIPDNEFSSWMTWR